ncbi:MAG: transposase family protein [Lyngbya sp. HA4199-MV5]|jgi:hypothetical protein|nr:transposase family protein [Lyngbya sp. HA4199-MV5]
MGVEGLIEALKTIPAGRRGRKVPYPLWLMLLMRLLGMMSGYSSFRGLEDFMQRHAAEVAARFGCSKAQLPRYSTLRDRAQPVEGEAVARILQPWANLSLAVQPEEALAMDGKALASTVSDAQGEHQAFVSVVRACVQGHACVVGQVRFQRQGGERHPKCTRLAGSVGCAGRVGHLGGFTRSKNQSLTWWQAAITTALD